MTAEKDLSELKLYQLATIVRRDWENPYFGAVPYLEAMSQLSELSDMYGCDDATDIVIRFLGNARSWRGLIAKTVKAELNRRLKCRSKPVRGRDPLE